LFVRARYAHAVQKSIDFSGAVVERQYLLPTSKKMATSASLFLRLGGVRISDESSRWGMARNLRDLKEAKIERPVRVKLSAKESLKRTQGFYKRKEQIIAAVRNGKS
jgi:hypothetical protein